MQWPIAIRRPCIKGGGACGSGKLLSNHSTRRLLERLQEWQGPFTTGLMFHPDWWLTNPADEELHGLRMQVKAARYSLEPLEP